MQPDRDTAYLWIDSGFMDSLENPIMISLLGDTYGGYCGHFVGTIDMLARNMKSYYPQIAKDISRNIVLFKNKYLLKIGE